MNKKLIRNIEKQKNLRKKKEEIEIELQLLAEEQEEIENLEVIKEFRSRKISLDEFLFIVRKNKEEENRERQELKRKYTNESEENL
ncbi:hypothetical protein HMPREF0072_0114 [Anaerococcus lactolyticus ATCC 51172]|uniref:Uncharacterized protein n=1 Tax=Anaerococcus lactolyticus ATCC 51172 TaxID=525254 RepID=C2BCP4_9FIRM|nr:hypothetical protein [Anaerococcus lactolyticus]EEI87322.1 hypothetical protein HMPREF0072_0114 [Anaerococcus lactolyticus ATCC 51172]